jgi:hypothetical protein
LAFYKRSTFLIDPRFQLRFSLIICGLLFVSSLIYPFLLLDFFNELMRLSPAAASSVQAAQSEFIIFLAVIQVIFIAFVFLLLIFMTHKVSGPLYKLKNHLAAIRQGEAITPLTFRTEDHFQDVAEEVSLFLETVSSKQESDFFYLDEVAQYLQNLETVVPDDKKPVLSEISRRLLDMRSRYKKPL